jgi:hypothetical protein
MPTPALTATDVGSPRLPGATTPERDGFALTAGGRDIWETSDEFHFAHTRFTGDFTLTAAVTSLAMADLYTKAGLMLRSSLAPGAEHALLLVFGDNQARNRNNGGLEFQYRQHAGAACTGVYPPQPLPAQPDFPASFPQVWLRLGRRGEVLTADYSQDGRRWRNYTVHRQTFPPAAWLGLALTSHNVDRPVRAVFRHVELTQP